MAGLNDYFRIICLVLNVARVIFFFVNKEYASIRSQLEPVWSKLKRFKLPRLTNLPTVFLFDSLVYCLALFVASYDLIWDEGSCLHWKICAVTITLAWINLLLHMRLLYGIGKYIILFQDVIFTFLSVSIVFVIMIIGFAFGFHILLSNRQEFATPYDALLKSFMMMSGEIDYGEIFFMDNPPEGFGDKYDQGHEKVPFPVITYAMFLVFLFLVSIVAINVLVGLTVDDIRNFLENADLRKLTMRLKFILMMERLTMKKNKKTQKELNKLFPKEGNLEASATSDLISTARIWEKIEKKQEESRKRGESEQERRSIKELINDQTAKLESKLRSEIEHLRKAIVDGKSDKA